MKKFTMFAFLASALVFSLSSFADELPRMSEGNTIIHGSNPIFNKAGGNTINLMAATYDPTNNVDPRDGVDVFGTGQRLAVFLDPAGNDGQYTFSAATLNIKKQGEGDSRVISLPFDLMFIYTDPGGPGNALSSRALLLQDVLAYFGVVGDPQKLSPVLPGITFRTSNYPNPFNPSTTIK
jgi:hypothetical protein